MPYPYLPLARQAHLMASHCPLLTSDMSLAAARARGAARLRYSVGCSQWRTNWAAHALPQLHPSQQDSHSPLTCIRRGSGIVEVPTLLLLIIRWPITTVVQYMRYLLLYCCFCRSFCSFYYLNYRMMIRLNKLSYVIGPNMYGYFLAVQKLIILLIVVVLLSAVEAQLHKILAIMAPR